MTSLVVTKPNVNSTVEIRVKNHFSQAMIPPGPNEIVYTGRVLDPYKWLNNQEFCLTSDDPEVPIRIINLGNVISIRYLTGQGQIINSDTKTWIVSGSKGNTYTVLRVNGQWSCSCPGF